VGYLPLAGAQRAGIANAAMCSLNWSDIYRHYCISSAAMASVPSGVKNPLLWTDESIVEQIRTCYANADAFLRATPGMAMTNLPNLISVAPIAERATSRRDEINQSLRLLPGDKLVLISMGGITSRVPIEKWPRIAGVRWLVQQNWNVSHPDVIIIESLKLPFGDLLASCDALICKPGYGSFVEATSCGVPVIYVNRPDWPESPALIEWLQQHNRCCEISRAELDSGTMAAALDHLWNSPPLAKIMPEGVTQVAQWLLHKLNHPKPGEPEPKS
jgi:hypothetical protein